MSSILFYGPGAHVQALDAATSEGRLLAPPWEDVKVDAAREISALIMDPPIFDRRGVVIIGGVDGCPDGSIDALLKALEDHDPTLVQPILWARDLGAVRGTLQSRCLLRWSPGPNPFLDFDNSREKEAKEVLRGLCVGDLVPAFQYIFKKGETRQQYRAFYEALIYLLTTEAVSDSLRSRLWRSIRPLSVHAWITPAELFLGLSEGLEGGYE